MRIAYILLLFGMIDNHDRNSHMLIWDELYNTNRLYPNRPNESWPTSKTDVNYKDISKGNHSQNKQRSFHLNQGIEQVSRNLVGAFGKSEEYELIWQNHGTTQ